MSTYEAWRAAYQDAEAAAKAAFNQAQGLAKLVDGLQATLGRQVRFGSEGFLTAIEKLPRYTYGYKSDEWGMGRALTTYASADGKFLLRDEVLAAIVSQAQQATPTADMGNTTSQQPAATEAGNPASGSLDAKIVDFLAKNYIGVDFKWGEPTTEVIIIEMPRGCSCSGDFRKDVTEAMATQAQQGGAA